MSSIVRSYRFQRIGSWGNVRPGPTVDGITLRNGGSDPIVSVVEFHPCYITIQFDRISNEVDVGTANRGAVEGADKFTDRLGCRSIVSDIDSTAGRIRNSQTRQRRRCYALVDMDVQSIVP